MNISIAKSEFYTALQTASHAVSSSSAQVVLRGILVEAADNKLTITASNADLSVQITLEKNDTNNLTIIEEGSILIEARYLLEIVRKIDSSEVKIEVIDGAFTKFSGNSVEFKINGMRPDDYPTIDFTKTPTSVVMKNSELTEIIDQTVFATATKDTRPVLTGVNFRLSDNVLRCTATDSFRLARKNIPFNHEGYFNITIPAKTLSEVKSTMLGEEGEIEITINDKKAQFWGDNMILQTRLLDGGYPETDRLIPKEFSYELTMNRSDLISAIDRTVFIKNENMTINRLQCSAEEIILTNKSQEIGESRENLIGTFTGEPLDISFSGNYVMDAARSLSGTTVKLSFTGQMKPFILTSADDDTTLQLVLPVRTYN